MSFNEEQIKEKALFLSNYNSIYNFLNNISKKTLQRFLSIDWSSYCKVPEVKRKLNSDPWNTRIGILNGWIKEYNTFSGESPNVLKKRLSHYAENYQEEDFINTLDEILGPRHIANIDDLYDDL